MLSSSSPSLSVSLDSFYIFIFFQKAIHPLKFCLWRSERVTRIWNLSGVTFGSVSVPLSLEECVNNVSKRLLTLRCFTLDWRLTLWFPRNLLFFVYFTPFDLFFTIPLHISRETVLFTQMSCWKLIQNPPTYVWVDEGQIIISQFIPLARETLIIYLIQP